MWLVNRIRAMLTRKKEEHPSGTASDCNKTAAAAAAPAKPFPDSVMGALKKYGDHAKAAYVLFESKKEIDIKGQAMQDIVESLDTESGCKEADRVGKLPGLKDHRGISSMLGYPGGKSLFGEPVSVASEKDQGAQPMRGAAAHKVAPVLLGCISERTGVDGVKEIVIAFRGTQTNADWITNFIGSVASDKLFGDGTGGVHTGFYNLIHTCSDTVPHVTPIQAIEEVLRPYQDAYTNSKDRSVLPRIITTGHSLGGALAVIAAVSIQHMFPAYQATQEELTQDYTKRLLQTYTFAAPRVGDVNLSTYLSKNLGYTAVQVVNTTDVVPFVPFEGLGTVPSTVRKLKGMCMPTRASHPDDTSAGPMRTAGLQPEGNNESGAYDLTPDQEDMLLAYEVLADHFGKQGTEAEGIAALEKRAAEEERQKVAAPRSSAGCEDDLMTMYPADLGVLQRVGYAAGLLKILHVHWADTPAPSFGTCFMTVSKPGRWGGQNHSLQVYMDHVDLCTNQPAR